jgi:hypothetical protein
VNPLTEQNDPKRKNKDEVMNVVDIVTADAVTWLRRCCFRFTMVSTVPVHNFVVSSKLMDGPRFV